MPFGNRSMNISRFEGFVVYGICFEEHQRFYNFFDPNDTTENFLNIFKPTLVATRKKVQTKFPFLITNFQPQPNEGLLELTYARI